MKRAVCRSAIAIVLCSWITSAPAQSPTDRLSDQAQDSLRAIRAGHYEIALQYIPPAIVESMGGPEKAMESMRAGMEALESSGMSVERYSLGSPSQIVSVEDGSIVAFVPTEMVLSAEGKRYTIKSYWLALSENQGWNWYFLEGLGEEFVSRVFPELVAKVGFPEERNELRDELNVVIREIMDRPDEVGERFRAIEEKKAEAFAEGILERTRAAYVPQRLSEERYVDPVLGFSIRFPEGWKVTDPIAGVGANVKKAVFLDTDGVFLAHIIVSGEEVPQDYDWRSQTPLKIAETLDVKAAGKYISGGETVIDGRGAIWVKFRLEILPYEAHGISFSVLRGRTLFRLDGQTASGDRDWNREIDSIFFLSIMSFKFL